MNPASGVDFPQDLIYPILFYVKDLNFLWTDCREVSREFARAAERVFLVRHLQRTRLTINLGIFSPFLPPNMSKNMPMGTCPALQGGKIALSSSFTFSRLDPTNPSRAIFADIDLCESEFEEELESRLRLRLGLGRERMPQRSQLAVHIRRDWINDTALPGFALNLDGEKPEVSFEWHGMCSALFREERKLDRSAAWVEGRKPYIDEMRQRVDDGEMGEMELMRELMGQYGKMTDKNRKDIRRERIAREVKEREGIEYQWRENEDTRVLEDLKNLRWIVLWNRP
ncbi:hypothetical protein H0H81_002374 [Sphagnurus paluster]|uniref:Uncharacterized protein n=1 Tax=Sphagnurus paluster TaxID=117069 RepID=A0A9P7GLX4_9AGAR|nr:hypothetical protein H0H81_002374 [Sphagnurus paluster]